MASAVRASGLTRDFGAGRGLFDLDLEIPPGQVFGYLGPNGAGKTTTIRLLMGLARPNRGSASILGLDCQTQSVEVKRHVGYAPGEPPQFGGLRGREIIAYLGAMAGGVDQAHVTRLSDRLRLDLSRRFREYSTGNKKKLVLVVAFMHRPQLLILDEPTSGLDPLNQQEFYAMVREARRDGATVFLSSHVLSEVEHVCDRVGIIRAGRLATVASLEELHEIRVHRVEMEFAGEVPVAAIRAAAGVRDVVAENRRVRCVVSGSFEPLMTAVAGAHVVNLSSHEPTLEESFLAYYSEPAHAAGGAGAAGAVSPEAVTSPC
ncbi:MAG TPA: ABC transporter ATP-binding protein [Candidatus Dormibacteraeota bacterium]|nr:ABC transporter ATP-binding protein [Candidatus Dormibacteraeota bacterium]